MDCMIESVIRTPRLRGETMKTLIIHHLESMWGASYKKIGGISYADLVEKFAEHLESESYDRVILTRFEGDTLEEEHWPIAEHISEVHEYAYGWSSEDLAEYPDKFCEGGNHSEAVLIEDWMRLSGEVFISGAFDGECIEDLEIALEYCGTKFQRINSLII